MFPIDEIVAFCFGGQWDDIKKVYQKTVHEPLATHMKCGKCGSNKIKIDTQQVRSGDEGQSCFCACQNPDCGATWRIE